jgi:hypothetical protein
LDARRFGHFIAQERHVLKCMEEAAGHAEATLFLLIALAPTEGYELAADVKGDLCRRI